MLSRLVAMEQIVYGGKIGEINLDHKGQELQYAFSARLTVSGDGREVRRDMRFGPRLVF